MAIKSNLKNMAPSREKFKSVITLLSHGYSCPEAFPDGKITVYPWDASIDDWVFTMARTAPKNGFMFEIMSRLCDLNGCPPEKFVLGDVNTVILVARSIRFNNVLAVTAVCPSCNTVQKMVKIRLPDELERIGEKTASYPGYDEITLPESQDVVRIRPLLIGDERFLDGRSEGDKNLLSDKLARILMPVVSVGGGQPDSLIELHVWHAALHPADQAFLENSEDALYPHLNSNVAMKCDSCHKMFEHTLELEDKEFLHRVVVPGTKAPMESTVGPGS